MKLNLYTTLLVIVCTNMSLWSQNPVLPHYPTDEERNLMESFRTTVIQDAKSLNLTPPPGPVRTMGEWEEIQALIIAWRDYPVIQTEIVRHAVNECKVFIITNSIGVVTNLLNSAQIPLTNVVFINEPYNSVWMRDYGPWTVYLNDVDSIAIADWVYNRPNRPQDDVIPEAIAEYLGVPYYEADNWIHTGGNHLVDGMGTAFSSDLILEENSGRSEFFIDSTASDFLGVNKYIKMRKLPFDGIHHLDMHIRVIDEETIMFAEYPEGVADGPQINDNIEALLRNYTTPYGNNYRIIRIPSPPDQNNNYPNVGGYYRTYTNSVFVNKTILVPTYDEQYDTTALRIYRENLPGYNVVGINCNVMITAKGALHCITKLVGVNKPLWIAHPRLRDTYQSAGNYNVVANVKHQSGIDSVMLYYRVSIDSVYTAAQMTLSDPEQALWTGEIPAQAPGAEVQYYIEAYAHDGKVQRRPIVAPEGYFNFKVMTFEAPPVAQALYRQGTFCVGESIQLRDHSLNGLSQEPYWVLEGGIPSEGQGSQINVSYNTPGVHTAMLVVQNTLGADTAYYNIVVEEAQTPYAETFETSAGLWAAENPDGDAAFWTLTDLGNCQGQALMLDNYTPNTNFTRDYLRARFSLAGMEQAQLRFDVAYAPYSNQYHDGLEVYITTCNGPRKAIYNKHYLELSTVPTHMTTPFTPSSCSQWRTEVVDLSDFAGQEVYLEFEHIGGSGNRLFLDNVEIINAAPNIQPEIAIVQPLDGAVFTGVTPPAFSIEANASDVDGAVNAVTFYVNGDSIGIDNQAPYVLNYQPADFGAYTLTARATDNDGAEQLSAPVQVMINAIVGLNTLDNSAMLTVFPNPVQDELMLRLHSPNTGLVNIKLVDALGRSYPMGILSPTTGENNYRFPVGHLPAGIYWVMLEGNGWRAGKKVVLL